MLTVREFRPEDAEDVSRIMYESFLTFLEGQDVEHTPVPPQDYIDNSCIRTAWSDAQAFVAVLDSKVIGYLHVSADHQTKVGDLDEIGVDPKVMQHGTGSAMFALAMEFWKQRGMQKIFTCTASVNLRAQKYYAKMGFKEVGRRRTHYLAHADEISLAFYLNPENASKPEFTIAPLASSDLESLAATLGPEIEPLWTREKLDDYQKNANSVFHPITLLAKNTQGKPLGLALLTYYPRYAFAYLDLLMTGKEFRYCGIAGALLARLEEEIHQQGKIRKIALNISSSDANSLPFLMRHGFVVEEALDHQAPGGQTEIHLGKFFA